MPEEKKKEPIACRAQNCLHEATIEGYCRSCYEAGMVTK
ncbi:hypothetical protein LCGC14_1989770 [marine sediment metagenome]|uniref:Uncharacterized protein n=1 Tax=marine sediment metagenome TaxID=412755 RepID=A0A0F9FUH4_9ZZZZ